MSDFGHFGGSDEEYATVRKHNAEVVSATLDAAELRQIGFLT